MSLFSVTAADTGASISDSLASQRNRVLADTGATISSTISRSISRTFLDFATSTSRVSLGVLDNFNRADGALTVPDWRDLNSSGANISSNAVIPGAGGGGIWQNQFIRPGFVSVGDQEWYVTVATLPSGAWHVAAIARTSALSTLNGYYARLFNTGLVTLARVDANVDQWADTYAVAVPVAGDKIGIRAIGSQIQAWYYHGGQWSLIGTHTDSAYVAGAGGFMLSEVSGGLSIDDFGGGPVVIDSVVATRFSAYSPPTPTGGGFNPLASGRDLLADLMPELAQAEDVQQTVNALAHELARVETNAYGLLDSMFPQQADDFYGTLALWEELLALPVNPPGVLLADRVRAVSGAARSRDVPSGLAWGDLITQILGPTSWSYVQSGLSLSVTVSGGTSYDIGQVAAIIRRVTPAHLTLTVS